MPLVGIGGADKMNQMHRREVYSLKIADTKINEQ